jgi:hypothetical protein
VGWRRPGASGGFVPPSGVVAFGRNLSKCQVVGRLLTSVKSWIAGWQTGELATW